MSNIQRFYFSGQEVRTIEQNHLIWWIVKDICDILELSNPTVALENLDKEERSKFLLGRQGYVNIINESGLYALILRSNKVRKSKR